MSLFNPIKFQRQLTWLIEQVKCLQGCCDENIAAEDTPYVNTENATETIGGYLEGEPITPPEGLFIEERWDKLFTNVTFPEVSFNVNNTIIEHKDDFSLSITITFTQNDAGAVNNYSLLKDGLEVSTTEVTAFTEDDVSSAFTLQASLSYNAGDNLSAGTILTPVRTITPRYIVWYGALANIPTNSAQVRAIANDVWDNANTITLQTGTTHNTFAVAIPTSINNSASLSAQDTTNNVSYTYDFDSVVNVQLPNGDNEEYRIYVLEVDNAYTTNAQHLIQI